MTSPNPKPKHPWVFDTETPITPDELDQIGDLGNEVDDTINDRQITNDSGSMKTKNREEKRHEGSQHKEGQ
jgi:hypothetical protein